MIRQALAKGMSDNERFAVDIDPLHFSSTCLEHLPTFLRFGLLLSVQSETIWFGDTNLGTLAAYQISKCSGC